MTDTSSSISRKSLRADSYQPQLIEEKWQNEWKISGLYKTREPKEDQKTFYALSMFPYPSGNLHMGHVRNYVITDVIARVHRMKGFSVLHPMGWDAFGLPAENAAIERNIQPDIWTEKNISHMRSQLDRLGLSIDWDREQTTSKSEYYKWTQSIFLKLYEAGLAYQKSATVNWDPVDKTVLANEQVDADGKSWRSGALVEKKQLKQWFLKITDYAEILLKDIDTLTEWPERVKTMQSNWIGKSVGVKINFQLLTKEKENLSVFTTRPDTLFGSTYLVLSPEDKLVDKLVDPKLINDLSNFRDYVSKLSDKERTAEGKPKNGMAIGAYAINPINQEKLPIWIADYVLSGYGTGAVMGVPAHDQRDLDFAQKYSLPIKYVIKPSGIIEKEKKKVKAYSEVGVMINSGPFNGQKSDEVKSLITEKGIKENWAEKKTTYKLRDWLISRQRYWGCPIPIVHCAKCGIVPIEKENLPVFLPTNIQLSGKGNSPLKDNEWTKNTMSYLQRNRTKRVRYYGYLYLLIMVLLKVY